MLISIEREGTGGSRRLCARVRAVKGCMPGFVSYRTFFDVGEAKKAMDSFWSKCLDLRDSGGLPCGLVWRDGPGEDVRAHILAEAEVIVDAAN
jgi:hypothetical protein